MAVNHPSALLAEDVALLVLQRLPLADWSAAEATCRTWSDVLGSDPQTFVRLRREAGWAQPLAVVLRTRETDEEGDDDLSDDEEPEDEEEAGGDVVPPVSAEDEARPAVRVEEQVHCDGIESVVTLLDVGTGKEMALPAHPQPCLDHAVVAQGGRVFVMGGCDGLFKPVRSVHVLAPVDASGSVKTWEWRQCSPMHHARAGAAAFPLEDGRIVVAGGWSGGAHLASVEIFDPATNSWAFAAPMQLPRAWAASGRAGNLHVVAGGIRGSESVVNDGCLASAEAFDPAANSWGPAPPLPSARSAPLFASTLEATQATASSGDPHLAPPALVCLGGRCNAEPTTASAVLHGKQWKTLPPLAAPRSSGGSILGGISPTKVASFTGKDDLILDLVAGSYEPAPWTIEDPEGISAVALLFR